MFRLAHLSDPHVGPLPPVGLGELMSKRILGYLSWTRRRRHLHKMAVLEALARDLTAEGPDHATVTGDLTNIALPGEFETAARWLGTLGVGADITVIPGNHDAYVAVDEAQTWGLWRDYMTSDGAVGEGPGDADGFPFLRRRGPLALIGLSTACPMPPAFATGRLGDTQLARLADLLAATGAERLCRVVLLHHPPRPGATAARKRLVDGDRFCEVIAQQGAELVLHGHDHTFASEQLPGPGGPAQVFGVPSASAVRAGSKPIGHYQIYGISQESAGWRIEVSVRGYDPAGNRFADAGRETVLLAR